MEHSGTAILEALVDYSQDPLVYLDREFNFVRVSRSYAETCRRAPEEFLGRNHFELYPHAENQAIFERVRDTGEPAVWKEKPFVFPDQPRRGVTYWDGCLVAIKDGSGQVEGLVLSLHDVTEKVQARRHLSERGERDRLKLESILSPEGDFGRLQLADIIDLPALQCLMDEFHKLTRLAMGMIDVRGRVLVSAGWQDLCTRFHRASPESLANCLESDTRLTAGVPAGESRLYKCKNNVWDVCTPIVVGGRHMGNFLMGQFFLQGEAIDDERFRAQARRFGFDEGQYLCALSALPRVKRETVDTAMTFFLKLADQLSKASLSNLKLARVAAEREGLLLSLQESKARLEESDRRKTEFLAVLSHELRNPLAPIKTGLCVLQRAAPGGPQSERARAIIERQVNQLSRLVDDLLDITRISRNKIQLQRAPLELNQLVRQTFEDHRAMFEAAGVGLEFSPSEKPVFVNADADRMVQVVGNLLQNASKFTPRGGRAHVALSCDLAAQSALIQVRDTGSGIAPGILRNLFQPFTQADRTLDRSKGGLGLGLALIKGIVELHGGEVSARSEGPDCGAEFTVRLPMDPAAALAATPTLASNPTAGRRMLIIEDNADAADTLREALELGGHDVAVAYDGPSGVALALELKPEFVLCDIGLPGMDGFAVARALRADPNLCSTTLLALTGYALAEDVEKARAAGFDRHLAKPIDLHRLERIFQEPRPQALESRVG